MSPDHSVETRLVGAAEASPPAAKPAPERGNATLERLHALVRKGYRAEIGQDSGTGIVVLRHLGRAPDLVLHSNGVVEDLGGRRPRHKRRLDALPAIAADTDADHLRFMKFLETVPRASLRDRTRPWRNKYVYLPVGLLLFWGLCLAFTAMIMDF